MASTFLKAPIVALCVQSFATQTTLLGASGLATRTVLLVPSDLSTGCKDATSDSRPRYKTASKGQCAEYGFVCVSTLAPKVLNHKERY